MQNDYLQLPASSPICLWPCALLLPNHGAEGDARQAKRWDAQFLMHNFSGKAVLKSYRCAQKVVVSVGRCLTGAHAEDVGKCCESRCLIIRRLMNPSAGKSPFGSISAATL